MVRVLLSPHGLSALTAQEDGLRLQAEKDLARRALPGAMIYFLVILIAGWTTPIAKVYPKFYLASAIVTFSVGLWRAASALSVNRQKEQGAAGSGWLRASTYTAFACWGIIQYGVARYQPHAALDLMLILSGAGLVAGASTSLAPEPRLAYRSISLISLPTAVGFMLRGDAAGVGMSIMTVIYYLFILVQTHQNSESYWGALRMRDSQAARLAAEAQAHAKAELLAQMSHEIRTPLHGVVGTLDLLGGTALDARQREYAQMARTASLSLLDVLNSILDYSKSEAGKMKLEAISFPMRPRIETALGPLRLAARAKGLEFVISWDSQLRRSYMGDPLRLSQVLINLASNAIKFTRSGVVGVRVQVTERRPGLDMVTFTVKDTGVGIPDEAQRRLFQPFEQARLSTSRSHGGTGLGLTISKQLVELMGGQMRLASVVGKGSSFSFIIPLPVAEEFSTPRELPALTPLAGTQPSVRVLVAEDNPVNRKVVVTLLERLGHQVDAVSNGEEAVVAAATGGYALVLMDCQMPVLDGLAAAQQIRAAGVDIPIIALTASSGHEDRDRALAAGMNDYLAKPYTADQLANLLAGVTSRRAAAQTGQPPRAE